MYTNVRTDYMSNVTTYIRTWCYFLKKSKALSVKGPDLQK